MTAEPAKPCTGEVLVCAKLSVRADRDERSPKRLTAEQVRQRRAELQESTRLARVAWSEASKAAEAGMKALRAECPHERTGPVDGGQYIGVYEQCLDCGAEGVEQADYSRTGTWRTHTLPTTPLPRTY